VLGDVVSAARRHVIGGPGIAESHGAAVTVLPIDQIVTRYSVRLLVNDRPGVLATIATVFADHGVSLETVEQTVAHPDAEFGDAGGATGAPAATATLVIGTHRATEAALAATVAALADNDAVRSVESVLRVEGI
ncbi:MAG TPA: ACT domain-containing protein, partial [Terrimesophilobacter sp.]|nr:ACT domain-containing protein [Terrimesophilobacter sp.]